MGLLPDCSGHRVNTETNIFPEKDYWDMMCNTD